MNMTPECLAAFESYQSATNEKDQNHWLSEMIRLAPPELQKEIRDIAMEMGLLPDNVYYTEAGEAVYKLQEIAELNGMTEEELVDIAKQNGVTPSVSDNSSIHRRQ